jgi:hypothetical protein
MTHPGVDLSVIESKNRRMTHTGKPTGSVQSDELDRYRSEKPYRLQL